MCAAAEPNSSINALIVGDSMISPANLAASIYDRLFVQLHQLMLRGGSCKDMARGIGKIRIQLPGLAEMLTIEELPGMTQASLFEWARCALQTDPDVLAMSLDGTSFEGWDPENTLPRIPCPVLLLQANPELDGLLSDADVALAKRLLPQAEHVKFPLLGHALFMQQPKPVLQAIVAFLEKYPSGGA
jgi:pimeloyl-ACP methyl ester carboxylesterase